MTDTLSDTLTAALEHALRGWHVHPIDHPDLPVCAGIKTPAHDPATCTDRGKHPCTKWGTWATTEADSIVAEWAGARRNVGISTGPSNLLVVDEDDLDGLTLYADSVGVTIPPTYTVRTGRPRGGRHYYFRMPAARHGNQPGALTAFGCDVRGDGGYVVAAGSKHRVGGHYTVEFDAEPAPCPDWLLEAIQGKASSPFADLSGPFALPDTITAGNLDGALGRDDTLFKFACSLRGQGVKVADAFLAMEKAWKRCEQPPGNTYPLKAALGKVDQAWGYDYTRYGDPQRTHEGTEQSRIQSKDSSGSSVGSSERRLTLTKASEVTMRPVRWLWQDGNAGRIPLGAIVIGAGRAGIGKSQFGAWLVAQITRGTLPGSMYGTPASVIYAAAEDSYEMTVVPRLVAAGADLERVFRVDVEVSASASGALTLPVDTAALGALIVKHEVALLVLDPMLSMIDASVNDYRAREVRAALEPLVLIADTARCTVFAVAHFTKSAGADPLLLIGGSAGFGQLVRAALGFARDDDTGECVLSTIKNNLGREDLPSLNYTIAPVTVDTDDGLSEVSKFVFGAESDRHVRDMLRDRGADDDVDARDEAADWLTKYLIDQGGEVIASDALKAAGRDGIARTTLTRARKRARVTSTKDGFGGPWIWRLSAEPQARTP